VAALSGVPSGRLVDRFGAGRMTVIGLAGVGAGMALLAAMPPSSGIAGYVGPIVVATASYALFQAANNTAVLADVPSDRRGVVSGLLNLSRNLGLVTGASAMGAVFAFASGASGLSAADAVATGMRAAFAVAALLVGFVFAVLVVSTNVSKGGQGPGIVRSDTP
jgi:MFS family permease